MKHPIIFAIAAVALLAATTLLWSHTPTTELSDGTAVMTRPLPALN